MFSFEKKTLCLSLMDIKILMIALHYYASNPLRKTCIIIQDKTTHSFENNCKARIALNYIKIINQRLISLISNLVNY